MNETQKEILSALFDGETSEFETRRLLSELDADSGNESRLKWQRYQLIRDASANKLGGCNFSIDISAQVSAQIDAEPQIQPKLVNQQNKESWVKPLLGFAVAASIAFVTVFSVQNMQQGSGSSSDMAGFIANGNVSASQLAITGGSGLNQVSGSATVILSNQLKDIEEQKLHNKKLEEEYKKRQLEDALNQ